MNHIVRPSQDRKKFRICDEATTAPGPPSEIQIPRLPVANQSATTQASGERSAVPLSSSKTPLDTAAVRLDLPNQVSRRSEEPTLDLLLQPLSQETKCLEDNWNNPDSTRMRTIPVGWIIVTSLVFIGTLIWSLNQWNTGDMQVAKVHERATTLLDSQTAEQLEATRLIEAIETAVQKYFNCQSVDELTPLVRHSSRVAPLMRDHYKDKPVFIGKVSSFKNLAPLNISPQSQFWAVPAVLSNGHKPLVSVEVTETGQVLVDWESLVCFQAMDWTEYTQKRPMGTTMDFRVYAEPVSFNSHEFKNSKEWLCVRLTAYQSDEFLFGYAKINSEAGRELRRLLKIRHLKKSPFTLRLSLPSGLQSPRGVVIDNVLGAGWILVDPPPPPPDSPPPRLPHF